MWTDFEEDSFRFVFYSTGNKKVNLPLEWDERKMKFFFRLLFDLHKHLIWKASLISSFLTGNWRKKQKREEISDFPFTSGHEIIGVRKFCEWNLYTGKSGFFFPKKKREKKEHLFRFQ